MSRPPRESPWDGCRVGVRIGVMGLVAFTLAMTTAMVWASDQPVSGNYPAKPATKPPSQETKARADVIYPAPVPHAIILHQDRDVRTLHNRGDVLFHPQDPTRSFTILRIHVTTIILRDNRTGQTWSLLPNSPVPGLPGHVFLKTVRVKQVRYEYRIVEKTETFLPVLISLKGTLAVLEKETLAGDAGNGQGVASAEDPSAPQQVRVNNPRLSRLVPVRELDDDTYELDAAAVKPALENLGQLLTDLDVMVSPSLSVHTLAEFKVSSAVADGILNHKGFTVTDSKLAQFFGIRAGDTVLRVNKQPVTSPLSAWWAYQELMIRNPTLSDVRVDIRRGDALVTKTYRLK